MNGRKTARMAILAGLALVLALDLAACGKDEAPAPPPQPEAPVQPEAAPADAVEPSPEATAATAPDVGPAAEEARTFPEGPVGDFQRALYAVAECEKREGSIRVKDRATCLEALQAARTTLRNPSPEVAPTPEARKRLREEHARVLREALDDDDPTVVLYALMHNQAGFDHDPRTVARLEEHMESEHRDIAEWAAIARFWRRGGATGSTAEMARKTLEHHRHDRVRLAACQYVGDATFRGNREHFDQLLERAEDGDEVALIRSCAVTRLGYVGTDEEIPTIAAFLDKPVTQYAAVFALQRGLRSDAGRDAYLDWFEEHADDPDVIQWGSMSIFLPYEGELERFPTKRAARILETVVRNEDLHEKARVLAVEHLDTLGDDARLRKLRKTWDDPVGEAQGQIRRAIDRALAR